MRTNFCYKVKGSLPQDFVSSPMIPFYILTSSFYVFLSTHSHRTVTENSFERNNSLPASRARYSSDPVKYSAGTDCFSPNLSLCCVFKQALHHRHQRCSTKHHGAATSGATDHEVTEAEVSRTPEDSVCSNEGPSAIYNDGPSTFSEVGLGTPNVSYRMSHKQWYSPLRDVTIIVRPKQLHGNDWF
jgi:hypothetical protein